jgi:hypothetical protein
VKLSMRCSLSQPKQRIRFEQLKPMIRWIKDPHPAFLVPERYNRQHGVSTSLVQEHIDEQIPAVRDTSTKFTHADTWAGA